MDFYQAQQNLRRAVDSLQGESENRPYEWHLAAGLLHMAVALENLKTTVEENERLLSQIRDVLARGR